MSIRMTYLALVSAISLQASAVGRSLRASQPGPTTAKSGQARARANRSHKQANNEVSRTNGIFGPTSFDSSVPEGPLSSWENKLRERLASIGSMECDLTWRVQTTPSGLSYSQLVPSTPRTAGIESGSSENLTGGEVELAFWITATHRDWKDSPGMKTVRPDGRSRIDQLPRQVVTTALWPTATTGTARSPESPEQQKARGAHTGLTLITAAHGSSDTTEKQGGLNPAFVCWLMGFLDAWESCAPTEMPSSRKSRRK